MIKFVLSWAVVFSMMILSSSMAWLLTDVTSPSKSFITYLFATGAVVAVVLITMYVTGLWTP